MAGPTTKCGWCYDVITPETDETTYYQCKCNRAVHGKCALEHDMCCACGEPATQVCQCCGACMPHDRIIDVCAKCDKWTCAQCPRTCKCGEALDKVVREYQCEAEYCRAPGANVAKMCPSCSRAFHTACVQPCRWCDFANGTMCPCGRGAYDANADKWSTCKREEPPYVVCPHGPNQTYETFAARRVGRFLYFVVFVCMMLVTYAWAYVTTKALHEAQADHWEIAKLMVLTTLYTIVSVGVPVGAYYHNRFAETPRMWRDMQAATVKDV